MKKAGALLHLCSFVVRQRFLFYKKHCVTVDLEILLCQPACVVRQGAAMDAADPLHVGTA